jgi:crcB protein
MMWVAVALGGALGAMLRYSISSLQFQSFPLGTLLANVFGCLLIGIFMAVSVRTGWPGNLARAFFVTGFLGALTTFSTFAYQTWELQHAGELSMAIGNLLANLVICFLALWIGVAGSEWFLSQS